MAYSIDLNPKVAVITGGLKGIGLAISKILAIAGAKIAVIDIENPDKAKEIFSKFSHYNNKPLYVQENISTQQGANQAISKIIDHFGRIDILVNNAGVIGDWDKSWDVNVKGVFYTSESAKNELKKQNNPKIIIISSASSFNGGTGIPQYVASKGGVNALIKYLAKNYAKFNIQVNGIAPAVIKSDMLMSRFKSEEDLIKHYEDKIPVGRIGYPEDIANIALFLSSELSDFMCGEILIADGGRMHVG